MGAPVGNQNSAKGRLWADAIKRAISRKASGDLEHGLDELAEKLVDAGIAGDQWALKEIGDRLDGKAAQAIIGGNDDDPPIRFQRIVRAIVHPDPANSDG